MQHEEAQEAEAGGLCAQDAAAKADALKTGAGGGLPFFFADAAFGTDEEGDLFGAVELGQEGLQAACGGFILVADELDVGVFGEGDGVGEALWAGDFGKNAALRLFGGAFGDLCQALGLAVGFFVVEAHVGAGHHHGDDAAGAELDGFLDDELELVALGQAPAGG